jgi:hypothetical protein
MTDLFPEVLRYVKYGLFSKQMGERLLSKTIPVTGHGGL